MRKITLLFLTLISAYELSACEICGCSSGNYFIGPTPVFSKHFIGTRYSFRKFHSEMKDDNSQFSDDLYQTAEIWGGIKINSGLQLTAFIPYNFNTSKSDDGTVSSSGFGDMTVIGSYNLLDKNSVTRKNYSVGQQWWIGAGIKTPTGKFTIDPDEAHTSANNQPGTGSYDVLLISSYNIVIDDWGLATNANYKVNSKASGFKFGNRFTTAIFAFRSFSCESKSFSPNIGMLYENLGSNEFENFKIEGSEGYSLLGAAGLEFKFDKINFGFNAQLPVSSNLSDGQTKVNWRGMIHLTYAF